MSAITIRTYKVTPEGRQYGHTPCHTTPGQIPGLYGRRRPWPTCHCPQHREQT
jgi:hypothetical protein